MAEAAGEAKKGSAAMAKFKKFAPMVFGVLILATSGVGAFFVFLSTIGWERPAITEEEEEKKLGLVREKRNNLPILYTLDKFTVNLEGNPKRIIQTEISLEMLDEKGFEEVVEMGAKARDQIVKLLNSKAFADIETIQGKLFLKDQIAMTLNQLLKKGVVKDVFFSQFVVQ